jgi:predicted Zn-ribbon and HTH transcriptional regulator
MSQTVRQMIIDILLEGPATAKELSARVSISEKEVFPHLAHIRKSPDSPGFSGRQLGLVS